MFPLSKDMIEDIIASDKKRNRKPNMALIFTITFLIGYILRSFSSGWLMFFLFIPEYVFRSLYYVMGMYILRKSIPDKNHYPVILLQVFYLLTSFFSFDFNDVNSYTFAGLWINPPLDIIKYFWIGFALTTIILLVLYYAKIFFNKNINAVYKTSNFFFDIFIGCVVAPIASFIVLWIIAFLSYVSGIKI